MRFGTQAKALRLNNPAALTRSIGEPLGAHEDLSSGDLLAFDKPTYGIRALAVELLRLEQDHGKGTLADIVRHWAELKGANPNRYLDAIAKHTGLADDELDLRSYKDLRLVVDAIIRGEQGRMPYADAQLVKGLVLAGVEPTKRPLDQSRTMRAGITAIVLALLSVMAEGVRQDPNRAEAFVREYLPSLLPSYLDMQTHLASIQWGFDTFLLVALGFVIWARLDDWRKGLR
jgi:hypothetical protein